MQITQVLILNLLSRIYLRLYLLEVLKQVKYDDKNSNVSIIPE